MRSLAATLLTLYLLRLPLASCTGGSDYEDPTGVVEPGSRMLPAQLLEQAARLQHAPCRLQLRQARELAQALFEAAHDVTARAAVLQPCEQKRNSELINSLLGLPKVNNNGGRK